MAFLQSKSVVNVSYYPFVVVWALPSKFYEGISGHVRLLDISFPFIVNKNKVFYSVR